MPERGIPTMNTGPKNDESDSDIILIYFRDRFSLSKEASFFKAGYLNFDAGDGIYSTVSRTSGQYSHK